MRKNRANASLDMKKQSLFIADENFFLWGADKKNWMLRVGFKFLNFENLNFGAKISQNFQVTRFFIEKFINNNFQNCTIRN